MIDIEEVEFKIISRAISCGDHTDVFLLAKHFTNTELAKIWEEVKDNPEVNVLEMTKRFDEQFLGDIVSNIPVFNVSPKQCADLIIEDYTRREFLKELDMVKSLVHAGMAPEKAMKQLSDIETGNLSSNEPEKLVNAMVRVYSDIKAISEGEKESNMFIPTGMGFYDDVFYGLERSAYTVIAARSSMGKTSFSMNIATNVAKNGHSVLVISLEMSNDSLTYRIFSSMAKLDLQLLRNGKVKNSSSWSALSCATEDMINADMYIDDSPSLTLQQLLSKVRRHKKKHGLDMLLIDYLGLMSTENKNSKKHEYISEISNAMPGLAKELDIALVALAQIGRGVEQRSDKRPLMSDLRDSGSIEQDADAIIMLYREEYYNKQPRNEGVAEVIVQKQRNGPTGTVLAGFEKQYATFGNLDVEKEMRYGEPTR